jgi:hypothetical protein
LKKLSEDEENPPVYNTLLSMEESLHQLTVSFSHYS